MENNNIIEFPLNAKLQEDNRNKAVGRLDKIETEQRRVMISASLFSIMFLMTLANISIFNSTPTQNTYSRGIASVNDSTYRNTEWEHKLAKKLSKIQFRNIATIGSNPSVEDKLRYGDLAMKYVMNFDDGQLIDIKFTANSNPKFVNDREQFLKENRGVLPGFDNMTKMQSTSNLVETYVLKSGNEFSAKVVFGLDRYGRFINLKVIRAETAL